MDLTCPRCHDHHVRRSHRKLYDTLLKLFGLVPYRCNSCQHRFFRSRNSVNSSVANQRRLAGRRRPARLAPGSARTLQKYAFAVPPVICPSSASCTLVVGASLLA